MALTGTKTEKNGWTLAASGNVQGGTVIAGGNVNTTTGPFTRNLSLDEIADNFGDKIGSKVVANDGTGASTTDRVGVAKAVSAGTLAYQAGATEWVMRGVSTTLGGVSNNVLLTKGTKGVNWMDYATSGNLHATIGDRKIGSVSDAKFDVLVEPNGEIVPGRTKGTGAGSANTYVNPDDGTDAVYSEIFPTRSVPGELTYHFGAGTGPKNDNYKAKDSYES